MDNLQHSEDDKHFFGIFFISGCAMLWMLVLPEPYCTPIIALPVAFFFCLTLFLFIEFSSKRVPMPVLSSDPLPESDDVLDFQIVRRPSLKERLRLDLTPGVTDTNHDPHH